MSTYKFPVRVPRRVRVEGYREPLDRERFADWLTKKLGHLGFLGVHEGTVLSEEAAREGLSTESWELDAAEAPRERDWIESLGTLESDYFFATEREALAAATLLRISTDLEIGAVVEQKEEDWDAKWKASFQGVSVPPFWKVLPPWVTLENPSSPVKVLRINPGAGFGTGTHETTQLCLQAIAELADRTGLTGVRALDFGSGSGILSIGAALLGAEVDAVEIDPLAIENAQENTRLNGVEARIRFMSELGERRLYPLVIANILRPVLLGFAEELMARWDRAGLLVLSGLMESDVEPVSLRYSSLIGFEPRERALGDWRALLWIP